MTDRPLKPDDQKAWDAIRRSVRPLQGGKTPRIKRGVTEHPLLKALGKSPATTPEPVKKARLQHPSSAPVGPQNRGGERLVRRGKVDISAKFDLHGHTQSSAWSALPSFLMREQARGSGCVIVITGKGKQGGGILRHNFLRWLEMPEARMLVSGYAEAHPRHGGAGAFYVFIRRR